MTKIRRSAFYEITVNPEMQIANGTMYFGQSEMTEFFLPNCTTTSCAGGVPTGVPTRHRDSSSPLNEISIKTLFSPRIPRPLQDCRQLPGGHRRERRVSIAITVVSHGLPPQLVVIVRLPTAI